MCMPVVMNGLGINKVEKLVDVCLCMCMCVCVCACVRVISRKNAGVGGLFTYRICIYVTRLSTQPTHHADFESIGGT